ncbi:MATE family efflux transporter [Peptococcaceae bacterium 1198_IL3148]
MNQSDIMRDQSIGKLLLNFSLPAIVGMLVNAMYNIISRIFVGQGVGPLALAATTIAFPVMIIMFAAAMLFGIGATALISIRLGQQKNNEAEKVMGNATLMLVIFPAIIAVIFFMFTEPILIAIGASENVLPYAKDYIQIIMLGSVFGSISFGVNNFIRAEGNPKIAMYTQILSAVVNIILHYIFIMKMGMGIKGAAWATVVAQGVSAVWVLSYFFTGKSLLKIRVKYLMPEWPILIKIMAIGFSPFAMQIAQSVQNLILNRALMNYGGDLALSAVGIMMGISTLLFMPIVGISQGAQPIIGYNYGAHQYQRVKKTLKIASIAGTVIAVVGYVALRIWSVEIISLFGDDQELINLTNHAMLVFFALLPVIGFQIINANYFQAVGKAREAAILSMSRQILFFIPLLLILPRFWGIEGVWRAAPIADFLSVIFTAVFIYGEIRKLNKKIVVAQ